MSDTTFPGFGEPKSNYSKLPHQLIDEMHNINSLAELKVILYILRHTWGYNDAEKRITNDEFCSGRKRTDGTRIDGGCGLSPKSIRIGLSDATEHGYILVTEDASDLGRIKRWYSLNVQEDKRELEGEKVTRGGEKVTPSVVKSTPRTEKETIETNQKKEGNQPSKETTKTDLPETGRSVVPAIPWQRTPTAKESTFAHFNARFPAKERRPVVDALIEVHGMTALIESEHPDADRKLRDFHEMACTLHEMKIGAKDIAHFAKLWKENDFRGKKGQRPENGQFLAFVSQQLADRTGFPAEDPGTAPALIVTDNWEA